MCCTNTNTTWRATASHTFALRAVQCHTHLLTQLGCKGWSVPSKDAKYICVCVCVLRWHCRPVSQWLQKRNCHFNSLFIGLRVREHVTNLDILPCLQFTYLSVSNTSNMYMYVHQTIKHVRILLISINKTYQATCNCFVIQRHTGMSRVGMVMWFCSLVSQLIVQACTHLKLL